MMAHYGRFFLESFTFRVFPLSVRRLLIFLGLFNLYSARAAPAVFNATGRLATLADVLHGDFSVHRTSLQWVSDPQGGVDGTYVVQDPTTNSLILANIVTGKNSTLVDAADLKGLAEDYYDYHIQPSKDHVLFSANYTKQYRHSFFADYYVFDRATKTLAPLVEGQEGDVQYAAWNPAGDSIAFVRGNDLYMWTDGVVTRITSDGGADVFNGVPDWVYEEEIYSDRYTLWFSPDGEYLAFLRFNETGVPTYTIPYYMAGQKVAPPYPEELQLRYPKVGEPNPTVTFHILSLKGLSLGTHTVRKIDFQAFPSDDLIISEVAWVAEGHEHVTFRSLNRVQDLEKLVLVDVESGSARVVRERDGRDGWIDNNLAIQYVPGLAVPSYVDLSDHTGWMHIYLYPVSGGDPIALTSGEWEVTSISKVDAERGVVYYISTERDSTERHLFSVGLDGKNKKALVDTTTDGHWYASFSSGGGYYLLTFNGPGLPYQVLRSTNSSTPVRTITDNAALRSSLSAYALPGVTWFKLHHPSGYTLNVLEQLPPRFRVGKRYPVLFEIYGGPGSQETGKTFRRTVNWRTYVGSDPELEYIVLTVDNRGTGFKGRQFRSLVTERLGILEAEDQIWAAKEYSKRGYVDKDKIVIRGWSFGGYLTAKVIERDSGVFSLGLITAPVTDWRFYDTMYTERYMKLLSSPSSSYALSSVHDPSGFSHVPGGVLIQHGTGDDNVHFQHSAALVDLLVGAGVGPEKVRTMWFTDSDHRITWNGAKEFLFRQLAEALFREKNRRERGGLHQWSRRAFGWW